MAEFTIHDAETAPDGSKPLLDGATAKFGFTPNLVGVLADSPAALKAYLAINGAVAETSLNPTEQQVVLLAASFENGGTYDMAAHSTVSEKIGVPADVVESLRAGGSIADPKLNALAEFTRATVRNNGVVDDGATATFLTAGYTSVSILDVVTAIAQKLISSYVTHFADIQADDAFA